MRFEQVVRSTPGQYISQAGALHYLKEKIENFDCPYIITGKKSYAAFCAFSNDIYKEIPVLFYDGTSSDEDAQRLATLAHKADIMIGVGGGKVCDTAKLVAELLDIEYITIPTVIGTCAPTSAVAAVYHTDKTFKRVAYFKRMPLVCLVDLTLLVHSPRRYFEGGICDTLVKWYEANSIVQHLRDDMDANVALGLAAAKVTQQILIKDTKEALKQLESQQVNKAFQRVVDTIFNVSAAVGGFACEYGRMAGAHAIHNALSLFPETHSIEHGVKVSYGLLVQLAAMQEMDELDRLIAFYAANGFIYSFHQLGIQEPYARALEKIAMFASSDTETFRLAIPNVTIKQIVEAIEYVEKRVLEVLGD